MELRMLDQGEQCEKKLDRACKAVGANFACGVSCNCFDAGVSRSGVVRIEGGKVTSEEAPTQATATIRYNRAATGLAADQAALPNFIYLQVDEVPVNPSVIHYSGVPGTFTLTLTPQVLGLARNQLPQGDYRIAVTVSDAGVNYAANEPKAVIVLQEKKALAETTPAVILLFALFGLFLVRKKSKKK